MARVATRVRHRRVCGVACPGAVAGAVCFRAVLAAGETVRRITHLSLSLSLFWSESISEIWCRSVADQAVRRMTRAPRWDYLYEFESALTVYYIYFYGFLLGESWQ